MKHTVSFVTLATIALVVSAGCDKPSSSTPAGKKPAAVHYDSIAVLPISGELQIKFKDGPETQKSFLQRDFPEELAREIAKRRPANSFKVVSPALVQEKQRPELTVRELGRFVDAQTVLVGKAIANTNEIAFQLVVADTGEMLWGQPFPVNEFRSGPIDRRPLLQDQQFMAESIANKVVETLSGQQSK